MQAAARFGRHIKHLSYCRRIACRSHQALNDHVAVSQCISLQSCRSTSTEVVPPPAADISSKVYPQKIQKLVTDISQLTLLEVADLNELLKKTLNIQDAPMMAMGAMPAAAPKAEEEDEGAAPTREKTSFTVKLTKFDAGKKVQLIKEIKNIVEGLNLVQAKKFVESIPQIVRADIPKEEAEKLKEALVAVGAEVEID